MQLVGNKPALAVGGARVDAHLDRRRRACRVDGRGSGKRDQAPRKDEHDGAAVGDRTELAHGSLPGALGPAAGAYMIPRLAPTYCGPYSAFQTSNSEPVRRGRQGSPEAANHALTRTLPV
jgi:hypothetical protein